MCSSDLNRGKKIYLSACGVKEENGKFDILFEAEVVESNGSPASGVTVRLYNNRNDYETLITEADGKKRHTVSLPLKHSEKKNMKFRVEIEGAHNIESSISIDVPKAEYKGWNGRVELWKHNWQEQKQPLFVFKITAMGIISYLLMLIVENYTYASIVVAGLALGGVVSRFTDAWKKGVVSGATFVAVSLLFPMLTIGAVHTAAKWIIFPGLPLYIYEDLSEKNGEKSNVFPWVLIWVFAVFALTNILSAFQALAGVHEGYLLSIQAWLDSNVVDVSLWSKAKPLLLEFTNIWPRSQHVYAFVDRAKDTAYWFAMALHWVIVAFIFLFVSAYGETSRWAKSKGKGKDEAVSVGSMVIFNQIFENVARKFKKT